MTDASAECPTIIAAGTVIKGEIKSEKGVRLLGTFEGEIQSDGEMQVAEGATLDGDVKAASIYIDGYVKGNLTAKTKVHLAASAKLEGDLQAARLEVAEGAVLIGRCVIGVNGRAAGATAAKSGLASSGPMVPSKKTSAPVLAKK